MAGPGLKAASACPSACHLAAAELFYNQADSLTMVDPGITRRKEILRIDEMVPDGYFGSANPAYVKEHGKVKSSKTSVI